jgi:DNA-binding transcriptional LysR family regulator
MTITKQTVVDSITVTENGIILYREATRIIEDGVQLTQTYHRTSLTPGQDLTGQPANVVAICNVAWTPEVVAAYQQAQAEAAARMNPQPE